MSKQIKILEISDILEQKLPFSEILSHANDYLMAVLSDTSSAAWNVNYDFKFDGLIFLFCGKGSFTIKKEFSDVVLNERNFMTIYPDEIVRGVESDNSEINELSGLFLTRQFLRDLNFNLNVFNSLDILGVRAEVIKLSRHDFGTLTHYFTLLKINAQNRVSSITDVFTRNIARNLTAALCYNLMLLTSDNTQSLRSSAHTSRKTSYVLDFMGLLQNNYKRERTIKFYAGQMCISPKYLSRIIKSATGKSAAQWIDECVILEAKNLLRFSGMNIQQVAYELNFSNQSSFGKYFKHITGMSPSSFQNT